MLKALLTDQQADNAQFSEANNVQCVGLKWIERGLKDANSIKLRTIVHHN